MKKKKKELLELKEKGDYESAAQYLADLTCASYTINEYDNQTITIPNGVTCLSNLLSSFFFLSFLFFFSSLTTRVKQWEVPSLFPFLQSPLLPLRTLSLRSPSLVRHHHLHCHQTTTNSSSPPKKKKKTYRGCFLTTCWSLVLPLFSF